MKGKYYVELYDGDGRRSLCLRTDTTSWLVSGMQQDCRSYGRRSVLSMRRPGLKSGWPVCSCPSCCFSSSFGRGQGLQRLLLAKDIE